MDLIDLTRTLDARNSGEQLLIEISNALNAGKQPSDEAVRKLSEAVNAMIEEEDKQQRLLMLQRKLGLNNPDGRTPHSKSWKKQRQGILMARKYWWHWFQGCKKGEAREKAAAECQLSGEFDEGYPSEGTVRNNVERYPQQAKRAFDIWHKLAQPDKNKIERAVDEINRHLEKNK